MALYLLEGLTRGLDYTDMMLRFQRWARKGYMTAHGVVFDMGVAHGRRWIGLPAGFPRWNATYDNGNSPLMRTMPVALYLRRVFGPKFPHLAEAYSIIHSASALTHAHPIILIACGIYGIAANDLLCGKSDIQEGIESAKRFYQRSSELALYLNG